MVEGGGRDRSVGARGWAVTAVTPVQGHPGGMFYATGLTLIERVSKGSGGRGRTGLGLGSGCVGVWGSVCVWVGSGARPGPPATWLPCPHTEGFVGDERRISRLEARRGALVTASRRRGGRRVGGKEARGQGSGAARGAGTREEEEREPHWTPRCDAPSPRSLDSVERVEGPERTVRLDPSPPRRAEHTSRSARPPLPFWLRRRPGYGLCRPWPFLNPSGVQ